MISAVMLMNLKGEVVIYRVYRGDVDRKDADTFRAQIIAKKETGTTPPIISVNNISYLYTRCGNLFFVVVTRSNTNTALAFQYLFQIITVFKAYFGKEFNEASIKNHFTLIYELLDECMDFGYPQNCSVDVLQTYINLGTLKNPTAAHDQKQITSHITGAIDWRRDNLKYRKNEVFIDVLEHVNLLMSAEGTVCSLFFLCSVYHT